jgi:hypothetical protein
VVISFDIAAYDRFSRDADLRRLGLPPEPEDAEVAATRNQQARALRHALAEFDIELHTVTPARALGEMLVS